MDEATRMAASLLFGKAGLNTWPWYRAAKGRMVDELGYGEMMHEARQELMRLLFDGVDAHAAMRETEAYLRGLWRPRYDYTKATHVPAHLSLDDEQVAVRETPDPRSHMVLISIRSELTEREWELVCAYADTGTVRRAAARCDVHYSTVARAVQAARAIACNTIGV